MDFASCLGIGQPTSWVANSSNCMENAAYRTTKSSSNCNNDGFDVALPWKQAAESSNGHEADRQQHPPSLASVQDPILSVVCCPNY
jgi:hypothetical protein